MRFYMTARTRLGLALGASSLVSLGLFWVGVLVNHNTTFSYLMWNLFLAWLPLVIACWLERIIQRRRWSSWLALLVTMLWLGFLPNSFYMITDYVHLQESPRADLLYDVVMFTSFIFNGVLLGLLSVFLVHQELLKRISKRLAGTLIGGVLFVGSFAVYVGRDLRWNTWDILVNPAGILVDISNRLLEPWTHPQVFSITLSFFVLLSSVYSVLWFVGRNLRQSKTE